MVNSTDISSPRKKPTRDFANINNRDRVLLRVVMDCDWNESEAARRLGCTPQNVNNRMRILRDSSTMKDFLDDVGLSDDYLAGKLQEGANAKVTKFFVINDEIEHRDCIDFSTRHKYVETLLKLRGHLVEKKENNGIEINVQQVFNSIPDEVRRTLLEKLRARQMANANTDG